MSWGKPSMVYRSHTYPSYPGEASRPYYVCRNCDGYVNINTLNLISAHGMIDIMHAHAPSLNMFALR